MTKALGTPVWVNMLLAIAQDQESSSLTKQVSYSCLKISIKIVTSLFSKILALRLLRTVLTEFRDKNMVESAEFLKKMSQLMGECLITCVKDPTLQAAGKSDAQL